MPCALRALLVVVFCAALTAGCRAERDAATLRIALTNEPATLDPGRATDVQAFYVLSNLYEGLTRYGHGLQVEPAVASSWTFSDDLRRITFHLRDDVVWSDGRPVVAADFVYAWRRLLDPETAAEYAYFLYDVVGAEAVNNGELPPDELGVAAPDDHTLVVDLERPATYFPHITTFMVTFPLREDVIAAHPWSWTRPEYAVTNGPFLLDAHRPDDRIVLRRNPAYTIAPVHLERAELLVVREANTAWALYDRGDIDVVTELLPLAIPAVRDRADFRNEAALEVRYVAFASQTPPMDDARVRRALALAIDTEQLVDVLGGGQQPARTWLPPGMFGYDPELALRCERDAARALLAEAGYPQGDGFPAVELLYRSGDDWRMIAENVQEQWRRELGIDVEVVVHDQAAFFRRIAEDAPPAMHLARWIADFPDPENFMSLFTSGSGNNHLGFSSPRYDELVDDAVRTQDAAARLAMYNEAQRILLLDEVAIAPLYVNALNWMIAARVDGIEVNPMGVLYLRDVRVGALP